MFNEKLQAQPYLVRNVIATAGSTGKTWECFAAAVVSARIILAKARSRRRRLVLPEAEGEGGKVEVKEGRQRKTRSTTNSVCREPLGQLPGL